MSITRHSSGYDAHYTLDYYGKCLLKLDKKQEAIDVFKKSLELHPDNKDVIDILSHLERSYYSKFS